MYFWFDVYRKHSDERIWRSRCIIIAVNKKDGEKRAKEPINNSQPALAVIYRSKSEDRESRVFKLANKDIPLHEGIATVKELQDLDLEIPGNQTVPYEYDEEPEPEIEEEQEEPKYVKIVCPYCKEEIPKNGAAQFSHLKKHIRDLTARGILTEEKAEKIRKIKLSPEIKKIFDQAYK